MAAVPAPRVMSGTFTTVWVDGVEVAGLTAFQAKWTKQKSELNMCGQMAVDSKVTSIKGTGSLEFHKVKSSFNDDMDRISQGIDVRHTIVGKVDDPDAYGAERIAYYNCSWDEHTMADNTAGNPIKINMPFTFTRAEYLDKVV